MFTNKYPPGTNPPPSDRPKPPPPPNPPSLSGSVGSVSQVSPAADGTLEIKGPFGKCAVLLELSEGMSAAHIETTINQRRYTIDIRPSLGSAILEQLNKTVDKIGEITGASSQSKTA